MNCKIGDKVRFLNETGGGTITRITSATMVCVEDKDGFEIPMRASDLVVVNDDETNPKNKISDKYDFASIRRPAAPPPEPDTREDVTITPDEDSDDYELLLAFVPCDDGKPTESDLDLFFVNDSTYHCMYAVSEWTKLNKLSLLGKGDLSPDTKEHVRLMRREEMKTVKTLNITLLLYKHRDYAVHPPEQVNVELNPLKFIRVSSFVENDFFDEKAYVLKIAADTVPEELTVDPKELQKAMTQKKDKPATPTNAHSPESEEIDLHIEALVDNPEELDAAQMIEIQKSRFTIALDLGISAGTRRMVFIHGVGNGKLKHEIRRLLDTRYAGKVRYQDASFKEYGYGATMVIL